MIDYAKSKKMVFFYDEVQQCSATFVGEFLHSAPPDNFSLSNQNTQHFPPEKWPGAGLEAFLVSDSVSNMQTN